MNNKDSMEEEIVVKLKQMLDHENIYAQTFRMTRDKFCDSSVCDLNLKLICDRQTDGRIYNLPKVAEVAALIVGEKRDIIVKKQSGRLKRIDELHPSYLPLQYPLLFPKGEDGYKEGILHKANSRNHAAKRKKSIDHAQTQGNQRGKMIILPSSFVRSHMVTRVFKQKLDDLINDLKSGQVFGQILGLFNIISVLIKEDNLINIYADVYTIEWKKRGLSHAHILIFLHHSNKQLTDEEVQHRCLCQIEDLLQGNGKSLRSFSAMPYPIGHAPEHVGNKLIHEELDYNKETLQQDFNSYYSSLTCNYLTYHKSSAQCGGVFFLYGYGGTRKTFMWKTLASTIQSKGDILLTVASSGIASLFLPGGKTTRSKFVIPVSATAKSPWPFKLIRRQFPFMVSFAMSINKSQGQSLSHVGLYLPRPVLSHGQLYVTLSKVQSKQGLHILIHDQQGKPCNTTINMVYKEAFQNL
ncbi:ATP-dependent DNA helicase PIF1 [Glycine soja]